MIDLSKTILVESNDITADDLIAGSINIKITNVSVNNTNRPVVIECVGANGKTFIPCKTMRRVLVDVWGINGADYIGESLTLYRDKNVKYGGKSVGGVRISHMTGISEKREISLNISRAVKYVFIIQPLVIIGNPTPQADKDIVEVYQEISQALDIDTLTQISKKYRLHSGFNKILTALTARKEAIINTNNNTKN